MPQQPGKTRARTATTTTRRGRIPAKPDLPDIRDLIYLPTLAPLTPTRPPPATPMILDQGEEGACTGFALAAVIHHLLTGNKSLPAPTRKREVSPRMLYTMARLHDEWPGEKYDGSSLRGALRGFFNNGACARGLWPDDEASDVSFLSLDAALDARRTSLGAYYRLRPALPDYHAALHETGVIYASAAVHDGWDKPHRTTGRITPASGEDLHAFAIVGYDQEGFWVQNSWGPSWGKKGLGHWSYEDWAANIQDAWVLQLAVEAPNAFGLTARTGAQRGTGRDASLLRPAPARQEIAGHFVHVRNGKYADNGRYWSTLDDVQATANLVATKEKHRHLLIYAHGGLNTPEAAARRTKAMTPIFKANAIYPYSVFYDTGLVEALTDLLLRRGASSRERAGGVISEYWDRMIEQAVGDLGTRLWREMKADATVPFDPGMAGTTTIGAFGRSLATATTATSLHLVGHSTGAILLGHLMAALDRDLGGQVTVETCSLLAPACSMTFYDQHFRPRLGGSVAAGRTRITNLGIYNLTDDAEQDDTVIQVYRKSLLYLVSNALEETSRMPLLGMDTFAKGKLGASVDYVLANPRDRKARSASDSHGGFDNDPATMNDILRRVLGGTAPGTPFTKWNLDYG